LSSDQAMTNKDIAASIMCVGHFDRPWHLYL